MLSFETLTYVPIDLRLIDVHLLATEERDWLDSYHRTVRDRLSPLVSDKARDWLSDATRAL